ncbi:hypothetical protein CANARDRAFT_29996 [[Candida] arabinofermentans NRRL YB-2248]|uniref:MoaB/Mog domain-containing protein n=1 Tax=[Candida] arabinofermentans NRRL YB-2248 TaxID=983967 RepID=A0A1E4SV48_9ASCO|nr:hypothetical protein CANARDRAFT_29996 [[Candida] arabinofermentans NRRL YB-2248]
MLFRNQLISIPKNVRGLTAKTFPVVKTAACIIIGDEVLNSKIIDTNSRFFAKFCYDKGIELKKITIIGDEEQDIIETVRQFDAKYDLIVTSGGIGPTHDDITYSAIAKAYNLEMKFHQESFDRYVSMRGSDRLLKFDDDQLSAFKRMFILPYHSTLVNNFYVNSRWVPIVSINGKLNILPGVPSIFEHLLTEGLAPHLRTPKSSYKTFYVVTNLSEALIAPNLSQEQDIIQKRGLPLKIGSYPHFEKQVNTISISGPADYMEYMQELVKKFRNELNGTEINEAQEFELSIDRSSTSLERFNTTK